LKVKVGFIGDIRIASYVGAALLYGPIDRHLMGPEVGQKRYQCVAFLCDLVSLSAYGCACVMLSTRFWQKRCLCSLEAQGRSHLLANACAILADGLAVK
jgi:hypothetical protein